MTIFQDKTTKNVVTTITVLALLFVVAYSFLTYRWFRVTVLTAPLVWTWLRAAPVLWREHTDRYALWQELQSEFRRNHPFLSALGVEVKKPLNPAAVVFCWLCLGAAVFTYIVLWA